MAVDPDGTYYITAEQNQVYLTVRRSLGGRNSVVAIDAAWAAVADMVRQELGFVPRDVTRVHWMFADRD